MDGFRKKQKMKGAIKKNLARAAAGRILPEPVPAPKVQSPVPPAAAPAPAPKVQSPFLLQPRRLRHQKFKVRFLLQPRRLRHQRFKVRLLLQPRKLRHQKFKVRLLLQPRKLRHKSSKVRFLLQLPSSGTKGSNPVSPYRNTPQLRKIRVPLLFLPSSGSEWPKNS